MKERGAERMVNSITLTFSARDFVRNTSCYTQNIFFIYPLGQPQYILSPSLFFSLFYSHLKVFPNLGEPCQAINTLE